MRPEGFLLTSRTFGASAFSFIRAPACSNSVRRHCDIIVSDRPADRAGISEDIPGMV